MEYFAKGGHIPKDGDFVTTRREEPFSILTELQGVNALGVPFHGVSQGPGAGIPQINAPIMSPGGEPGAVG